jgi:molecular chaperone DnaJ
MANEKRDFYEILEVSKSSSAEEIKKAYRKLAQQFHPDRNPGNKAAEEKFKEMSEAYEVLSDPKKRQAYDQLGHAAFSQGAAGAGGYDFGGGGAPFQDIFSDVFGELFGSGRGTGGRKRKAALRPGDDLQMQMDITFEQAAFGGEKQISFPKAVPCEGCMGSGCQSGHQPSVCSTCSGTGEMTQSQGFFMYSRPCSVCNGSGQMITHPCTQCKGLGHTRKNISLSVKIPPGVDTGQQLKLVGEGAAGQRGGPPGDLYIVINILPHEFFSRDGFDVICEVPIKFTQAALGAEVEVPSLEGKLLRLNIPAGTQSHKILRLKGRGLTRLSSHARGDQLVRVIVEVPSSLSAEQKELLHKFDEMAGSGLNSMHQRFFDKVKTFFG